MAYVLFSVLRGITNNELFTGVEKKHRDLGSHPQIKLILAICKAVPKLKIAGDF